MWEAIDTGTYAALVPGGVLVNTANIEEGSEALVYIPYGPNANKEAWEAWIQEKMDAQREA